MLSCRSFLLPKRDLCSRFAHSTKKDLENSEGGLYYEAKDDRPLSTKLMQSIRRRTWSSLEELNEVLYDEWSKITMEEVRTRIQDMSRRCETLVKIGGKAIKTELW